MRLSLHTSLIFVFALGLGVLLALMSVKFSVRTQLSQWKKILEIPHSAFYKQWLQAREAEQASQMDVDMLKEMKVRLTSHQIISEAKYLDEKVSVVCVVKLGKEKAPLYMPSKMSAAVAVSETWATRCNTVLFFSNMHWQNLKGVININFEAQNMNSWEAMLEILQYLYANDVMNNHEWVLFAEEDTYIIMENLKYFLSIYNSSVPCYFGHAYRGWGFSFNDDGPGFVLSKTSFRKLTNFIGKGHCRWQNMDSATVLGQCLSELGIEPQDTRDTQGRARFLPRDPQSLIVKGLLSWSDPLWAKSLYVSPEGPDCCSDDAISFHEITPNMMYIVDYLVNRLKPYGISPKLVLRTEFVSKIMKEKYSQSAQPKIKNDESAIDDLKDKLGIQQVDNVKSLKQPNKLAFLPKKLLQPVVSHRSLH